MGKAIGIDLGTTNSVISIRVLKSDIIPNKENETLTPSVVAFNGKDVIVGRKAQDLMLQDPENTISSVKRLMGRSFADPAIQNMIQNANFSYKIIPLAQGTASSIGISLKNQAEITPQQVSGEILKKLKTDAEFILNDEITEAVITVPAYFNEKQKHATYQAAEFAGFKVSRLLSEPSAAAIAYGIDESQNSKTILIYDFGGGTLDISILSFADGHFMEQAKGGDMWLGGDDIDNLIFKHLTLKISEEFSIDNFDSFLKSLPQGDMLRLKGELKRSSEKAKIQLSQSESVLLEVNSSIKAPSGMRLEFDLEFSRTEFNNLIDPIIKQSEQLVEGVIKSVHFTTDIIDSVLMVGGTSSIPALQSSLQKIFGSEKVKIHDRPMHAIAEGAAILAKKLAGTDALTQELGQVMYRSAHDYYLQLANGDQLLLVEKQSVLPITTTKSLSYEHPSQLIGNFCFSSKFGEQFEPIGELWLSHFPNEMGYDPDQKTPEIILQFTVTEDELVHVQVALKDQPEVSISKTISRGAEDEKLFNDLKASINSYNKLLSEAKETEEASNKGFNFIYYTASIAKHISESFSSQMNNFKTPDERFAKIDKIKDKLSLALQLCTFDEDLDEEVPSWWNEFLYFEAIGKFSTSCFADRGRLIEYKLLVAQFKQSLEALENFSSIKNTHKKCEDFLALYAPEADSDVWHKCGGNSSDLIAADYHSSVRLGLTH